MCARHIINSAALTCRQLTSADTVAMLARTLTTRAARGYPAFRRIADHNFAFYLAFNLPLPLPLATVP